MEEESAKEGIAREQMFMNDYGTCGICVGWGCERKKQTVNTFTSICKQNYDSSRKML